MSNTDRIHSEVLQEHGVDSAVVRARVLPEGLTRGVVYVVPSGAVAVDILHARLEARLRTAGHETSVVPVSKLPRDASGALDEAALQALPVFDHDLLEKWETQAVASSGVPLAVVASPKSRALKELPLEMLLPSGSATPAVREQAKPVTSAATGGPAREGSLSVATGPELRRHADDPRALPDVLRQAAQRAPERGLVHVQPDGSEVRQTYPELLAEAEVVLGGLQVAGVEEGAMALLQLERSQDFVAAFWACLMGGIVPVPVSIAARYDARNAAVLKLRNAWKMLDQPVIIVGHALQADVAQAAAALGMTGAALHDVEALRQAGRSAQVPKWDPENLALLLLTSGSTGFPKAVMHNHRTLIDRSLSTVQANGYTERDTSVNWMPLDHVGGIIMYHLRDTVACAHQVHAPTEYILQEPLRWLDLIDRHGATDTWAPNFAFGLINERLAEASGRTWDLSTLRFILNGGEAIVAKTARRFLARLECYGLPATAMHPAWGMSETSSGVTYNDEFRLDTTSDDDPHVVVGKPIPGIQVRVADERDQPVPEGSTGRLQVRGVSVTPGYHKNPELNAQVFTPDGWFTTGDLGVLQDGQLAITGREKDEVIINGVNYVGAEIEAVVDGVEGVAVSFSAACAVRPVDADTDHLAVFFSPEAGDSNLATVLRAVTAEVGTRIGISPRFLVPLPPSRIPKTAIGKIQRRQLRERFECGDFAEIVANAQTLLGHTESLPAWFYQRKLRSAARAAQMAPISGRTIAFVPDTGRGRALASCVPNLVRVEPREAFEQLGADHYCIHPTYDEDYERLWAALSQPGDDPAAVVFAWAWGDIADRCLPEELAAAHARGLYSLLRLVRTIGRRPPQQLRIVVVTSDAQTVDNLRPVAAHAALLGVTRSLTPELAWADVVQVDVQTGDLEREAAAIAQELPPGDGTREVVHTASARLVPQFVPIDFEELTPNDEPLVCGGFYIVSGGMGGVGTAVGRCLCERLGARLLILGRQPLQQGTALLDQIVAAGGQARYVVADVTQEDEVRQVVACAAEEWGPPNGVLHLAGKLDERLLLDTSVEQMRGQIAAKIIGAAVLHQALGEYGGGTFISFSSLAGSFGWAMLGGYGAANAFLGAYAKAMDGRDGVRHYCYEWSTWDGLGMSRESATRDVAVTRGFAAMRPQQGVNSLLVALRFGVQSALIGLDGTNPHVARLVEQALTVLLEPVCCYEATTESSTPPLETQFYDRLGQPVHCAVRAVPKLPRDALGRVDREVLARGRGLAKDGEQPSELEQQLVEICREVLGSARVEVHDDLFALGVDSLTGMRLLNRIGERLRVELSLRDLFETSTVSRLAARAAQRPGREMARSVPEEVSAADAQRLLARVDEMSEDEVNRTLAELSRTQN